MAKIKTTIQLKEKISEAIKQVSINYTTIHEKQVAIENLLIQNIELMKKCLSQENIEIKSNG